MFHVKHGSSWEASRRRGVEASRRRGVEASRQPPPLYPPARQRSRSHLRLTLRAVASPSNSREAMRNRTFHVKHAPPSRWLRDVAESMSKNQLRMFHVKHFPAREARGPRSSSSPASRRPLASQAMRRRGSPAGGPRGGAYPSPHVGAKDSTRHPMVRARDARDSSSNHQRCTASASDPGRARPARTRPGLGRPSTPSK